MVAKASDGIGWATARIDPALTARVRRDMPVLEHRSEIKHAIPERAADVAYRLAYDVLARRIMYGPRWESELSIPWDDLVDEVIRAAIAYLRFAPR